MTTVAPRPARAQELRAWMRDPEHRYALLIAIVGFFLLAMRQGYRVPLTVGMPPAPAAACVGLAVLGVGFITGHAYAVRAVRSIPLLPTAIALAVAATTFVSAAWATTGTMTPVQVLQTTYVMRDAVCAVAIFLVIVAAISTRESIVLVLRGLVAGAAVSSLMGLIAYATGQDLAPLIALPGLRYDDTQLTTNLMRGDVIRPQGSAGHPLELSSVLTIMVPIAIGLAWEARRRRAPWWPWAGAGALLAVGAAATVSRSALVGFAVAVLVFSLCWPWRRTVWSLIAGVATVGVLWLLDVPMLRELINVVTQGSQDGSLQSRSLGRDYAARQFIEHPWVGQGAGTYDVRAQPVLDNNWLMQLIQVGIVGVTALAAFSIMGVVVAIIAARRARRVDDALAEISYALIASTLIVIVIGTVLDIIGFPQVLVLSTVLVALAVCARRAAAATPTSATDACPGSPTRAATPDRTPA